MTPSRKVRGYPALVHPSATSASAQTPPPAGHDITAAVAAERDLPTLPLEPDFAATQVAGASQASIIDPVAGVSSIPLIQREN